MSEEGEEEEMLEVESKIAPPDLLCPSCNGLLPHRLGEVVCLSCESKMRIDDPPTRKSWKEEKFACLSCGKVLVAGIDKRPAKLRCSSCHNEFRIIPKKVKTEIECPSCQRRLRVVKKPGSREVACPACDEVFRISF